MFELPELVTLAAQSNEVMQGRVVAGGFLGNRPHKFVWYNRSSEEFTALTAGRALGRAHARGRWLFVPLEPGYVLVLGEFGGRMLFHRAGVKRPDAYHLLLEFEDGAALSVTTSMWGAMELYEAGKEQARKDIHGMRATPLDPEFDFDYFLALLNELVVGPPRSVKGLLTQEQLVPGLGNSIAQDIAFRARLHPRHAIAELQFEQRRDLYEAIVDTVRQAVALGGRNDEVDLYGNPGGYARRMDKSAAGRPCARCGTTVQKFQYLGGACYVCPTCQA